MLSTESCLLDSDVESGETLDEDDLLLASVCVVSVLDRGVKDTLQNVSIDVKPKPLVGGRCFQEREMVLIRIL